MTPHAKRIIAGILLTAVPLLIVYQARQSVWGSFTATRKARQKGNPKAKILLVEYSDFQCPMCARVQPALRQLLQRYDGKVRMAFKHFPLAMHKNAMPAARAAECAAEQNQFWPYQDRLFETQSKWGPLSDPTSSYLSLAGEVGLDAARFSACLADPGIVAIIQEDVREARERKISATPTLFIQNDRLVGTYIETDGARLVERYLRREK